MATQIERALLERIATALERIVARLGKPTMIKVMMPDGTVLAETVVKAIPAVLANRRKPSHPQPAGPASYTDEQLALIKACKRRVRIGSVWHRKAGKGGVLVVEVVGRGVTHAILKHRGSDRESRSRYDYFAVNIPGCHGQYQKGEPTT